MKDYLLKMPYEEARIISMWRSKMFPPKCNFPNRWSSSKLCEFCLRLDTDEHLLKCCGYMDLHQNKLNNQMFWTNVNDKDMEELRSGARILQKIHERLLVINEERNVHPLPHDYFIQFVRVIVKH